MYFPKQSAELPSSTCSPATEQVGASTGVKVSCSEAGTLAFFCATYLVENIADGRAPTPTVRFGGNGLSRRRRQRARARARGQRRSGAPRKRPHAAAGLAPAFGSRRVHAPARPDHRPFGNRGRARSPHRSIRATAHPLRVPRRAFGAAAALAPHRLTQVTSWRRPV